MLLFFIMLALAVVGLVLYKVWKDEWDIRETLSIWGLIVGVAGAVSAFIMGFICIISAVELDGMIESKKAEQASLTHQLESGLYDNDNDIGKKELMDQITEFNKDKATHDAMHDNIWTGMLYPDIYEDIDYVRLDYVVLEGSGR